MTVVIAIDSFKGSLSSVAAGEAAAAGVRRAFPDATCVVRPLADGGEGTVDALVAGLGGARVSVRVTGPAGRPTMATYGLLSDGLAVMEMAQAAGITLVSGAEKDPRLTTTFGVGEMILDARARGATRFLIGIGGSATNDGGAGMLQALGWRLLDADGRELPRGGAALARLARLEPPRENPLAGCTFRIACDVTNPLCGPQGTSAVFGPQKGATPEAVAALDAALAHWADVVGAKSDFAGAGAAGGLGYGFKAILSADLVSGVELVLSETKLADVLAAADVVVTGEGRLDGQTVMGKAPIGVARLAKRYGKPVIAFAGCLGDGVEKTNAEGIDAYFPILRQVTTLDEALDVTTAAANLTAAAEQAFRLMAAAFSCRRDSLCRCDSLSRQNKDEPPLSQTRQAAASTSGAQCCSRQYAQDCVCHLTPMISMKTNRKSIRNVFGAGLFAAAVLLSLPLPALTRIGIITDTHIGAPGAAERLERTYRLLQSHGVTNIFNLGDIADQHVDAWYKQYVDMRARVYPNGVDEVFVYHNHDKFGFHTAETDSAKILEEAFAATQRKLGAKNGRYHSFKLEGFTFLVYPLGVDYRRMEDEIKASVAADPGKPVFVLDHVPPLGTSAGSESHQAGNATTAAIFRKYPQVVALTGHVHGSVANEGKIWQREFTAVGFGTTKNPAAKDADYHIAIMELDPQKAVIRRYSLATGREYHADDPWTLTFPFDPLRPRYSREVRAKTTPQPGFAAGAKPEVTPDHDHLGGLVVSFPGAQPAEWTSHYTVSVEDHDHDHDHPRSAVKAGTGLFVVPEEKRPSFITAKLDPGLFTPGETVKVSVTPNGFFGNAGAPISSEATVTNQVEEGWVTVFDGLPKGAKKGRFVPMRRFFFPASVWDAPPKTLYRFTFEISVKQFDPPPAASALEIVTDDRRQFIGKIRLDEGNWTRRFSFTRPRPKGKGPWCLHFVGGTNLVEIHSFRIQRKTAREVSGDVLPPPIQIDVGRQLFVDDHLVASTSNVVRHWNQPTKMPDPIVWPGSGAAPARADGSSRCAKGEPVNLTCATDGGLWWDPTRGKFRLWYQADWLGDICYAESEDGDRWEYPEVGVVPGTNRLFEHDVIDSWCVSPDYAAENPYGAWRLFISEPGGRTSDGLWSSSDGLHFTGLGCAGVSGDRSTAYYDPFRGVWTFSLRDVRKGVGRCRRLFTSPTFGGPDCRWRWPSETNAPSCLPLAREWLVATNRPNWSLYSFDAVAYESLMLGVMEMLYNTPKDNDDCMKVGLPKQTGLHFVFSRDGTDFTRPRDEADIAPSGWGSGAWDTGYLSCVGGICVIRDERLWFYYSGLRGDGLRVSNGHWARNGMYSNGAIGAATLRRDGFAGMVADARGELTTKPVVFSGGHLFVNAECRFGSLRAEVLDIGGRVLPGFSAADCEMLARADTTRREVRWKDAALASLAGRPVRFRFGLHCGTLYSFWVSKDAAGASGGYVAAGGPAYAGLRDLPRSEAGTMYSSDSGTTR